MPDPVSILIVTIVSALLSLGVLGSMLSARVAGVRDWVTGCSLSIASLVLVCMQAYDWPKAISVIAANQLLMLGLLIILQGCRKFAGIKPVRQMEYLAWLLILAGMWYWTYYSDNLNARIALVSVFHAYIYFSVAWISYQIRPDGHFSYAYRFVCIAASIGGLTHAVRGLTYGLGLVRQNHLLETSSATTLFLGLGIVALPCLAWRQAW